MIDIVLLFRLKQFSVSMFIQLVRTGLMCDDDNGPEGHQPDNR